MEQVNALAKRERVPARIAKGDLEGKMKCRIWRKLHPEEARRFDQVYELMEKHPELDLADAFGVLQSGLSPKEFLERKAQAQKKAAVKQARSAVPRDAIDAFVEGLMQDGTELCIVLAERTLLDVLKSVEPTAFTFGQNGRVEKLQVVLMSRRDTWEKISHSVERDAQLAEKPAAVIRQPEKRPVSDPRIFAPRVGEVLTVLLRNGLKLKQPIRATGPFDLLLGEPGRELFLPLHAIVQWQPLGATSSSATSQQAR